MRDQIFGTISLSFLLLAPLIVGTDEVLAKEPDQWVFLENAELRVGLLKSHGGALGFLAQKGTSENLLNHFDHGRLVQQSYYGDPDGSMWGKKPWTYNPVQGGSYQGVASEVVELQSTATTAYVKTVPRHWAAGRILPECTMEQWVELQGALVKLRYKFAYAGEQTHAARHQEIPAVFVNPRLDRLVYYAGDQPWQNKSVDARVPGWPNEYITLSEHWAAYVDERNQGLGILVPLADSATCYRFQGGNESSCSYIAPLTTFALQPGLSFEYEAWLTLGDVETIRQRFQQLAQEAVQNP